MSATLIRYLLSLSLLIKSMDMMKLLRPNNYYSTYQQTIYRYNSINYHRIRLFMNMNKRNRDGLGKAKGYADSNLRYVMERETESGLPYQSSSMNKPFIVLGIESSCDDTGVAVVRSDGTILSNIIYSQQQIHEKFGGIVPGLAMKAHQDNIDIAVTQAIATAGLNSLADIDAVAVTKGPGLEICLRVGFRKAQAIAKEYQKPFVTVHHLEAHCMITRLAGEVILQDQQQQQQINNNSSSSSKNDSVHSKSPVNTNTPKEEGSSSFPIDSNTRSLLSSSDDEVEEGSNSHSSSFEPKVEFPFLVLLASGGHTSILICHSMGEYTVLGGTLDDALGEAFDKAARLLGLKGASSGGAAVEKAAASYVTANLLLKNNQPTATTIIPDSTTNTSTLESLNSGMSVPMRDKANCDFSYAGLKNSFRLAVQKARLDAGLQEGQLNSTNAPASQMEEAPTELVTLPEGATAKLCYDFQNIAFTHVEDRIKRALDYIDKHNIQVNALVVVGGVAANKELRKRLLNLLAKREKKIKQDNYYLKLRSKQTTNSSIPTTATTTTISTKTLEIATRDISQGDVIEKGLTVMGQQKKKIFASKNIKLIFPPPQLCTDNGVMIAWTGIEKLKLGISNRIDNQEVIPRWPLGQLISSNNSIFNTNMSKAALLSKE